MKAEIRRTMEMIVQDCVSSGEQMMRVLKSKAEPQDFDCYKQAVKTFSKNCYNLGKVMGIVLYLCRHTLHAKKHRIMIIAGLCFAKHFRSFPVSVWKLPYFTAGS